MRSQMLRGLFPLACLGLLALSACAAKEPAQPVASSGSSSKVAASSSRTSTSTTSASSSSESMAMGPWTEAKTAQLQSYILDTWGPAMGQVYKAYTPATLGNFFGVPIPDGFLTATKGMTADMGGQVPELFWSMDGVAQPGQLAVVAVYADSEANRSMAQHLYVFTVDPQGFGQVWITQQNQGNPEGKLYFHLTQNEALRDFFSQLVGNPAGMTSSVTETSPVTGAGVDTKNLTANQAANWASAHKAKGYGAPYTRVDFTTMVTGIDRSPDGLVYIEVRENHNSPTMRAAGAAPGVASNLSSYRINAAGHLELMDLRTGNYQVVETSYYE